jgi:hypothetical protein
VGFVAIVGCGAVVATKPSSGVGFVTRAARGSMRATKPTGSRQYFVAAIVPALLRATKCWL